MEGELHRIGYVVAVSHVSLKPMNKDGSNSSINRNSDDRKDIACAICNEAPKPYRSLPRTFTTRSHDCGTDVAKLHERSPL